jgi:hypothetical protein
VLNPWRCSCPYNWFLETSDGEQHTVSSDREANRALGFCRGTHPGAFRRLAKPVPVETSTHRNLLVGELGKPFQECLVYDEEKVERIEREWAEVRAAHQLRGELTPKAIADITALSVEALSLLRSLQPSNLQSKTKSGVYPYQELHSQLQELEREGLIAGG